MPRLTISQAAATNTAIVAAPGAGKSLHILSLVFTTTLASQVSFSEGTDGTTTRIVFGTFAANGGGVFGNDFFAFKQGFPANTALNLTNSAGTVEGVLEYEVLG